jgi:hypothetical protein
MLRLYYLLLTQGFENQWDKIVGQKGLIFSQIVRFKVVVVQTCGEDNPETITTSICYFTKYV